MDRETESLQQLLKRYANGDCTPEEIIWIENWYNRAAESRPGMMEEWDYKTIQREVFEHVQTKMKAGKSPESGRASGVFTKRVALLAAAAAVLIAGAGIYLGLAGRWGKHSPGNGQASALARVVDVAPGGNKATLTLANGKKVALDSTQSTILMSQAAIQYDNGTPVETSAEVAAGVHDNILTTPKGGQYQIVLEDGTKVWLNAESTLTYPTSFARDKRVVEVTGEAYFSVANESGRPFKVVSRGQEIQVLGTEFDIKSYEFDRESKTTLVNGSVRVDYTGNAGAQQLSVLLAPAQQAVLNGNVLSKREVDVESEIAWKNGFFRFNRTSLEDMMQQVSRWYDIDVHYARQATKPHYFYGKLLRSYNLSQVLKVLKAGGVDFGIRPAKDGRYELSVYPD